MTSRELAERALSGALSRAEIDTALREIEKATAAAGDQPVAEEAPVPEIDESRREGKLCELCGGFFTRAIGRKTKYCVRHIHFESH